MTDQADSDYEFEQLERTKDAAEEEQDVVEEE